MEKDIKREALRQYFKYFKIWFIIAGILAVITIGAAVVHALTPKTVRDNSQEPAERVYDYADMLTDEEEQSLREYIAECESPYRFLPFRTASMRCPYGYQQS